MDHVGPRDAQKPREVQRLVEKRPNVRELPEPSEAAREGRVDREKGHPVALGLQPLQEDARLMALAPRHCGPRGDQRDPRLGPHRGLMGLPPGDSVSVHRCAPAQSALLVPGSSAATWRMDGTVRLIQAVRRSASPDSERHRMGLASRRIAAAGTRSRCSRHQSSKERSVQSCRLRSSP